ncbi:hypothetical protein MPTK1_6g10830 [Marchantia polymorpha subsp. ruderalis]|uniref:Uncharacterized protein n=2 Tax=Marchantia polymorpha TaxID=3197 RepID=A0AAF6BQQ5_MARPO|nr:hypothetical protein MARPO_0016s0122 [Marchantia polymorpha]BBN14339.1 hypothetical protein Mp_6g10830 [Marchantia polymorpha subsp. ruderalis]|eukprot:PTQ45072.1 hypothetical protein MARPO_0016s0122 [Marchantia polymorpha]
MLRGPSGRAQGHPDARSRRKELGGRSFFSLLVVALNSISEVRHRVQFGWLDGWDWPRRPPPLIAACLTTGLASSAAQRSAAPASFQISKPCVGDLSRISFV